MTDDTIETVPGFTTFTELDVIDWSNQILSGPVIPDPKSMSVKADTKEDIERLWRAVQDYAAS